MGYWLRDWIPWFSSSTMGEGTAPVPFVAGDAKNPRSTEQVVLLVDNPDADGSDGSVWSLPLLMVLALGAVGLLLLLGSWCFTLFSQGKPRRKSPPPDDPKEEEKYLEALEGRDVQSSCDTIGDD